MAVTEQGSLWSWGSNKEKELGFETANDDSVLIPTHVDAFGGAKVITVSAGNVRSAALTEGGPYWQWGSSMYMNTETGEIDYYRQEPTQYFFKQKIAETAQTLWHDKMHAKRLGGKPMMIEVFVDLWFLQRWYTEMKSRRKKLYENPTMDTHSLHERMHSFLV